jgi:hypothetical protein
MVTSEKIVYRDHQGIAMIELIFSIVIMGIVLLSAPMLIQQSIRSGNVAIQQEAIAAAASQTSVILSMHWDENNNSNSLVSPMLDINRDPFDFDKNTPPLGLTDISGRQSTSAGETLPAVLESSFGKDETTDPDTNESDYTDFDDVDDYHNSDFNLTLFNSEVTTSDVGDYIDTKIKMRTTINYAEDRITTGSTIPLNSTTLNLGNLINTSSPGTQTNIKFIHLNLSSSSGIEELEKNITFEAFSCNIGTTMAQGANHK